MKRPYVSDVSERVAPKAPPPPPPPAEVRADSLTPEQKRIVWEHIKTHDANLLAFLRSPEVARLVERYKAVPLFPKELVEAALRGAERRGREQ